MKIRKQVYELSLIDITEFPVWEFALDEEGEDEQDEAAVRPFEFTPLSIQVLACLLSKQSFYLPMERK